MSKKLGIVLFVIVLVGALGYLFIRYFPKTQTGTIAPVVGDNIVIKSFSFSPNNLSIKVGDTVTWTNEDSATHTIKSDTFNSGYLGNGDKFTHTFPTAGTYNYSCSIHPSMTGQIIVK